MSPSRLRRRPGHQLTDEWITDEAIPLAERLVANNGRMIEHAMGPTDAWTLYQRARGSNDAELRETMDRFVNVVVSAILLNHFGPAEPPPLARVALKGYLAFFAAVLDEARTSGTPQDRIMPILTTTLEASLTAASD